MIKSLSIIMCLFILSCKPSPESQSAVTALPNTPKKTALITNIKSAASPIIIDGRLSEKAWTSVEWKPINQVWLGEDPSSQDFQGKYKITWTPYYLYVGAEIIDDILIDTHEDGLDRYWDDDCLEIFVDENGSKGNHQYNHNAFAYHISLEGVVTDIGTDSIPRYYKHVNSKRITEGNKTIWETAIELHPDTYQDDVVSAPAKLSAGKKMGFAIAYCDNDQSVERENFIGSIAVKGEDKNRGWIDAGIFEEITLTK